MKILVEVFHPNLAVSKVNACLMNELKKYSGSQLKVRDEYAHYPDWQIDVAKEQALLE
ncbi:hypothetical protein PT285_08355 [Lactobacillus sp. ESL0791]|uniref:hypothetical protein n=1 Tax=Lactobacillus sp. ESL0791 TaxID=2983234 RepID=UPI0023F9B56B|nr:hypothetical protein [Lactobacillus sp. ESL0791]